jgi:DUF1365 family protein
MAWNWWPTRCFHVSPFCNVEGGYRFRFMRAGTADAPRTVVRIDYDDADGPLLQTSVSGSLQPATSAAIRQALWRYPAMTLGVVARIHWQAAQAVAQARALFPQAGPS